MEPRGARRHRLLAGSGSDAVRPRRGGDRSGRTCTASCPRSSSTTTPDTASRACRTAVARSSTAGSRTTRPRSARGDRVDFLLVNHVLLGGPVGAACGSPYVVKAHGSELEYSMRGNEELSRWGAEVLAGAQATLVGSEHIREVVAEICGAVERRSHDPARGRHRALAAAAPRRSPQLAARRVPRRSAEPREPQRAAARRGQRRAARLLPGRRPEDRRLLREADPQQGRPGAPRGAPRARRPRP